MQAFGVELGIKVRDSRYGDGGKKWHVDATYLKVEGSWCYLYRAIDKEDNLIDVYLSDVRDQAAAEKFFMQAQTTTCITPIQITTDKEPALYKAIESTFPKDVMHRDSKYMNNRIEQSHRGIKSRIRPMKEFKDFFSALIFSTAFEEIKQFFLIKNKSRADRPRIIPSKINEFNQLIAVV